MNVRLTGIGGILTLTVSACASPKPNTLDETDLENARNLAEDLDDVLVPTNPGEMPDNGTATYTGGMATAPDVETGIIGEMEMTADFDAGTVSGNASNVNILVDGNSDIESQMLTGTLDIDGTITSTSMEASMTGDLGGVIQGFSATFSADMDLDGEFASSEPLGTGSDVMAGLITGDIDISVAGNEETMTLYPGDAGFVVCTVECDTLVP